MKITTALLKKHGICAGGAKWVKDRFGNNGDIEARVIRAKAKPNNIRRGKFIKTL